MNFKFRGFDVRVEDKGDRFYSWKGHNKKRELLIYEQNLVEFKSLRSLKTYIKEKIKKLVTLGSDKFNKSERGNKK
jgi:hypothetical protein